jgi:hypothetical protein
MLAHGAELRSLAASAGGWSAGGAPPRMKKLFSLLVLIGACTVGAALVSAADSAPKSVMHVVTVTWKAGTTPAQIDAALAGAHAIPAAYPAVLHVWTKTIKQQGERTHVIAMEFKDEEALKNYTKSPAQEAWYKLYLPIREHSTTFDVTN